MRKIDSFRAGRGVLLILTVGYTAVMIAAKLKAAGFFGAKLLLVTLLMTLGAALVCSGIAGMQRRKYAVRQEAIRRTKSGALALLMMPENEALEIAGEWIKMESGARCIGKREHLMLFMKDERRIAFGILQLVQNSPLAPEKVCTLYRKAKEENCAQLEILPCFDPPAQAWQLAAQLREPKVLLYRESDAAPLLCSYAPENPPHFRRMILPKARRQGKKLFFSGSVLLLLSMILRAFFLPGLALALFGVYLHVHGAPTQHCGLLHTEPVS